MQRLKSLRKLNNMSRQELGEQLGISKNMIAAYEQSTSHPNSLMLLKISNIFNVSIDYLLENEKETKTIYDNRNTTEYGFNNKHLEELKRFLEKEQEKGYKN